MIEGLKLFLRKTLSSVNCKDLPKILSYQYQKNTKSNIDCHENKINLSY